MVEYRVVSLSTNASFSLTTPDDYMIIEFDDGKQIINFEDKGLYDLETLNSVLGCIANHLLQISLNDKGLIEFRSHDSFTIISASHRVQLLFGLYHETFPIKSQTEPDDVLYQIIISNSIPYWNQGQVLYLLSRTDAVVLTNARGQEESQSIAFKTHELIVNGYPIVSINNGNWFKIKSSQLQQLRFILVDFMLEPVILHAPLYITVEVIDERLIGERFKKHLIDVAIQEI